MDSTKRTSRKRGGKPARKSLTCTAPECGRGEYALGLCQTHHRQMLSEGALVPIRPYRRRVPGTVKFAGLRLTPGCAATVRSEAEARNLSCGAVIADILERWCEEGAKPPPPAPNGSGAKRAKRSRRS